MDLKPYFEQTKGHGVLATADASGRVNLAIFARPHVMEDNTVAFIMPRRLTHNNLPSNVLKVVGIDLMAAGDIDADGKLSAVVHTDSAKKTYRKLVIRDNLLVGAILLGDIRGSAEIQAAINKKTDISLLKGELAQADFDFKRLK